MRYKGERGMNAAQQIDEALAGGACG